MRIDRVNDVRSKHSLFGGRELAKARSALAGAVLNNISNALFQTLLGFLSMLKLQHP
jgi:hypothetical protein